MDILKILSPTPKRGGRQRLGPAERVLVMTMIGLAVVVVLSLIWVSVVNPDAAPPPWLDGQQLGAVGPIRGMTDWLLLAGCGAAGLTGIGMLAIDLQARKLGRQPARRQVR